MARPGLTTHRKFRRLARALGSPILAMGVLELLWQPCYESGDDYLGTAEDIETLVGWTGAHGALTLALADAGAPKGAGFIDMVPNDDPSAEHEYRVHDLWHHAPDYVKKRHKRESQRKQRVSPSAKRRRSAPNDVQRMPSSVRQIEDDRTPAPAPAPALAPSPTPALIVAPEPQRAPATVPILIRLFDTKHREHLDVPAVIDGGKDAGLLAKLCRSHGCEMVAEMIGAFFQSDDPFIRKAGFTVGVFYSQFSKLLTRRQEHLLPPARSPSSLARSSTTDEAARESLRERLAKLKNADEAIHGPTTTAAITGGGPRGNQTA